MRLLGGLLGGSLSGQLGERLRGRGALCAPPLWFAFFGVIAL